MYTVNEWLAMTISDYTVSTFRFGILIVPMLDFPYIIIQSTSLHMMGRYLHTSLYCFTDGQCGIVDLPIGQQQFADEPAYFKLAHFNMILISSEVLPSHSR